MTAENSPLIRREPFPVPGPATVVLRLWIAGVVLISKLLSAEEHLGAIEKNWQSLTMMNMFKQKNPKAAWRSGFQDVGTQLANRIKQPTNVVR